jgi:hypothetical protein
MSIPGPTAYQYWLALQPLLKENYWKLPSRISRIISILFDFFLPRYQDISNGRERVSSSRVAPGGRGASATANKTSDW